MQDDSKPKKSGNPNWVKGGKSPNPAGRPKAATELRQALEHLAHDAGERLKKLLNSKNEKIALDATKFVIDHVKGKAPQALTGEDGSPLTMGVIILPAEKDV